MVLPLIKGVICIFIQLGGIVGGSRKRRETQGRADLDRYFREFETFMYQRANVLAKHQQRLVTDVALDEQCKLVTAQPRYLHGIADSADQPFSDQHQQPVTDTMAIQVVDRLEPVQIQHTHR
ncbi:hypothetical protein ALP15_200114 [Pseudomonas savastanoi]|uniref:Uncharacterized protein n=1 Tax=Pseudomonas savastanoi TaxID=29438 RepID=A0A3M6A9U7_PSESS|nr:hypothetical protein ALP15_200114 [Pseudomonas savastanoi]